MDIMERIIEYFKENTDVFNDCMQELNSYTGYLGDDEIYSMDMLDELYNNVAPSEILARAFYGYDAETDGAFNPNREYFYFNGYGNLVSCDSVDYSDHLDEYAINEMLENRRYIDAIDDNDELAELFDILENGEDEEEEEEE